MATVRIQKNILEEKVDVLSIEEEVTIEEIIRKHTNESVYEGTLVECYDTETGETFFSPIEENSDSINALVQVNGKDRGLDYKVQKNDIVNIIITPCGGTSVLDWSIIGAMIGAFVGMVFVVASGGTLGAVLLGAISGASAGWLLGSTISSLFITDDEMETKGGLDTQKLPDVRGASNQPLLDNNYPFVLGKHLVSPFIIGSPWNEISGDRGQTNYIHCLYAVGYAPLRLTDFKLGEMFLAHNQRWNGNDELENVFHGALHGIDTQTGSGEDHGDIVSTWANNDITVEILQQGQNGESIDYGTVYPYAKIQEDIKANVLYIADGTLEDIDRANNVTYKGLGLQNGLRNNPIRFTQQYPRSIKVELDFNSGLYKTRSETQNKTSTVKYYKIPMWTAIQWRVYSEENDTTDGSVSGELSIPEFDYNTYTYTSNKRGWISFETVNGNINTTTFTQAHRNADIDAHTGNDLKRGGVYTDINTGWYNAQVFNLQPLGATNEDAEGANEIRCVTNVNLIEWARANLLTAEEREGADAELWLMRKFKAYFFCGTNTTKSVEVRVVRISPCYLDEPTSSGDYSAFKFNDVFTWNTLTSEMIDGDELMVNDNIVPLRPLTEERMRKLCIVSLKAKTDNIDQLSNTIKQFSCIAQSFAPYYDEDTKKWVPENVNKITKYYKPPVEVSPREWQEGQEITEEQFYEDRQNGIKSTIAPSGNDFVKNLVTNVIRTQSHIDERNRYFIPYDDMEDGDYKEGCDGTLNYCTNNVASMFLLAGIGPMAGVDAMGYEQSFYENGELKNTAGDFNMTSLATWAMETKELKDGSFYPSDGYHYDYKGNYVHHTRGEEVKVFFSANAYIYSAEILENILTKIATAGRAVYTRDNKNRLTVIMDKPEKYPVALINQQNTLSSSYNLSFEELPSGLQMTFPDETDGYEQNTFYCMVDGENSDNPRKAIEQYSIAYVTNAYQQNSLGRYLLANRILNKEVVSKKIGMEGASIALGDLVLVQDDTMLIGTDNGGRVTQLIESEQYIYGFVINNTFHYTGEEETYTDGNNQTQTRCVQGVVVLQPSKYKESRLITLRLAKANTSIVINGKTFVLKKGNTNTVLFDRPVAKDPNDSDYYVFRPQLENLVSFGKVGSITSTYRVIKIKPDSKRNYELTLSKYQEELYQYGRALPSFQNNMTISDRRAEDFFPLSDNVKTSDVAGIATQAAAQTQGVIDDIFGKTPSVPQNLVANVSKDGISITCSVETTDVNTIDYILYEITKYRNNNGIIEESVITVKDLYATNYLFKRDWEGYPEKKASGVTENDGSLDFWKFRAKTVSIYTDSNNQRIQSAWSDYVYLTPTSLLNYGTWNVMQPTVNVRVSDRTITLICSQPPRSDGLEIYGNIKYKIQIKKTFDDNEYYKPATSLNPYESEDNYKDGYGYVLSDSVYIQTVPLTGQDTDAIEDTPYTFRVVAINEKNVDSTVREVTATALCTSIRDVVKANETAKESYISNLTALCTAFGAVSSGMRDGVITDRSNYWVLNNGVVLENDANNIKYRGAFRVGGDNQYLLVRPINIINGEPTDYEVEFKVGNFQISSTTSSINGELIVQESDHSLDRTVITPVGTYYQHRESISDSWFVVDKMESAGIVSPSYKAEKQIVIGNATQEQIRQLGHDIGRQYLTPDALVWHFDGQNQDTKTQHGNSGGLVVTGTYDNYGAADSNGIDFTPAILAVSPYCTTARCLYGQFNASLTVEDVTEITVDFWIQYLYAEAQTLFEIGTLNDKIALQVEPAEPLAVVSGVSGWRRTSGVVYCSTRNPHIGDYAYRTAAQAEAGGESVLVVTAVTYDACYAVLTITVNEDVYNFDTGMPDMNWETYAPEEVWGATSQIANRANNKKINIYHKGQVSEEVVSLESLGKRFEEYQWVHVGVVFCSAQDASNPSKIKFLFGDEEGTVEKLFNRYGTAQDDVEIMINEEKNSFILDELYVDKTVEMTGGSNGFAAQTVERIPWAALDKERDYFIFDAKDPSLVKSNILDHFKTQLLASQEFDDAVMRVVGD